MSEGCGFESKHRILDGYFFTFICRKNCNVCLKRRLQTIKWPGMAHLKNKKLLYDTWMKIVMRTSQN